MDLTAVNIFWWRRDLLLNDNSGLFYALKGSQLVIPIFIFKEDILTKLNGPRDKRVQFIYKTVTAIKNIRLSPGSQMNRALKNGVKEARGFPL